MNRSRITLCSALTMLAAPVVAHAGPVWDEIGDAGSETIASQTTDGNGKITAVRGELTTSLLRGLPDTEDLYLIRICDPAGFAASLLDDDGGMATFNSQLFLFKPDPSFPLVAFGLLANDDAFGGTPDAKLLPLSTDDSGAALVTPGLYYLGISVADRDPASAGGPIFDQVTFSEISGPDGDGGASPLLGFGGPAGPVISPGTYFIALSGTAFGSTPAIDCNCNGRVDACDIAAGDSPDDDFDGIPDECACNTDFDGIDGTAFPDLLAVLSAWGPC